MNRITAIQNAVLTAAELDQRGIGRSALDTRVKNGQVIKIRRSAYAPHLWWDSLKPSERYLAEITAYSKTAKITPVFSHDSAVALHGLVNIRVAQQVHIIGTSKSPSKALNVIRHYRQKIASVDANGLQLTPILETVVDCARIWPFRESVTLADSALYTGTDQDALAHALTSVQGAGAARARAVSVAMSKHSESAGESITRLLLKESGLPTPSEQVTLTVMGRNYRPVFLWWDFMVILEFDGNIKYGQIFGEREEIFRAQNEREERLRTQGFTVVRTDWDEVMNHPYRLIVKLKKAFGQR
ncbi:type IV toxin-antitoxin system AbiEi family antitoxin domain-containing protein [Rothia sp. ZJ1223]|uniref:type IV toxin-antitoxin system AbiEi family antitoxin domain-containing protein n=1 Tax=Rothia sp. ZJ1223 TaxID=2811098 RepID=UPI00195A31BE|nr:type IV toxin-antitoxin system AbiEi family antitoxin domain-containing protein [Rothia sp. ZJ1223]MBM7050864.1 type IV toxin-antitoxin system AbiEi family antitoxin domain-containing protein [Rothia sp. ZJ1223]